MRKWARAGSMVAITTAMMLSVALPAQAFAPAPGPAIATLFEDSVGVLAGAEGASVFLGPADAVAAPSEAALWAGAFGVGAAGIGASYAIQTAYEAGSDWSTGQTPDNIPLTPDSTNFLPSIQGGFTITTRTGINNDPNDSQTDFQPVDDIATTHSEVGPGTFEFAAKFYAGCKNTATGATAWRDMVWSDNRSWRAGQAPYAKWGVAASTVCYGGSGNDANWVPSGPYGVGPATQHEGIFYARPGLDGYDPAFTLPGVIGSSGVPGTAAAGSFTATSECTVPGGAKQYFTNTVDVTAGYVTMPRCQDADPGSVQTGGTIANQPAPDAPIIPQEHWQIKPQPQFPDCDPTLGKTCKFQILVDGQPCTAGRAECEGWTQIRNTDPTRVQCKWGSYLVDSSNCNILERAYNPGGAPATPANTDGDPATGTNLAGNPWNPPKNEPRTVPAGWPAPQDPQPSAPPVTDPQASPSPSPSPSSGAVPGTDPTPGSAGQPSPSDPSGGECFPSGWQAFNPVEWVLKPVGCALSLAFVPSPAAVQTLTDGVATDMASVGIKPISDAVGGIFAAVPTGQGGCSGPMFHFSAFGIDKNFYPLNACDEPLRTMAVMCNAITTIGVVVGGGLALLRALSAGFGYRFTMGGKDS